MQSFCRTVVEVGSSQCNVSPALNTPHILVAVFFCRLVATKILRDFILFFNRFVSECRKFHKERLLPKLWSSKVYTVVTGTTSDVLYQLVTTLCLFGYSIFFSCLEC